MALCLEAHSRRKLELQVEIKEIADVYAKILKKYKAVLHVPSLKTRSLKFPLESSEEVSGWKGSRLGLSKAPLLF